MSYHIYKKVEVVGSSDKSTDDAIRNAIEVASHSLEHMDWFEVVETRGEIRNGVITYFQVTLKIGFRLNDEAG
ncbi:MAG: dodecin flavoprotein [Haliea sp.]|jgi:flavin-binding protein dodecin|nr:dodecin flavoprotein [Haliea sp.]